MKKQLQEVTPRSARSAAPLPAAASGSVMSVDDLPADARSQQVEESLERAVLPQRQREEESPKRDASPIPTPVARPALPATKMIATPIDAQLRQRVRAPRSVRDLRGFRR